jgi:hypothetical protein
MRKQLSKGKTTLRGDLRGDLREELDGGVFS